MNIKKYMRSTLTSKIDYNQVPTTCLEKNILGWLDINKKGKRKNILLLDRNIARTNYIKYIQNKNIAHRDLKPGNILV